jgi:sugar phosphate isomerase/epimerase
MFLRQTSQAAAAATLMAGMPRALWANPLGLPIGIQLYSVKDDLQTDVPGTLKQLRAIGYKQVEAFHYSGFDAQSLRAAMKAAGLECPSVHLNFNQPDLASAFETARTLGARYAVSSTLRPYPVKHKKETPLTELTLDDYKAVAKRMNDIGRQAKQAGFQYAYHNHDMEFRDVGGGKVGYDVLLQESDPELVQFEMDCGWVAAAGYNPVDYFQKYPTRFVMLHIKQFTKDSAITTSTNGPTSPQGTELGRGKPDYKPIFAAAKKIHIRHYFVEQEPPFLDMTSMEAAKVDYNYLHSM